jgi:hypothetical protein
MSAVSRALNGELTQQWVQHQQTDAHSLGRWGAPIWKMDDAQAQTTTLDVLPLEITQLALLYCER